MLCAVDAPGIELMHHVRLRDFDESEGREELRRESKGHDFARFHYGDPCDYGLDERTADAAPSEDAFNGKGLHFHGSGLGIAKFRMYLVCGDAGELAFAFGDEESIYILDYIAKRFRHKLVAIQMHERKNALGILKLRGVYCEITFHSNSR